MLKKVIVLIIVAAFVITGLIAARGGTSKAAELAAMLPDSDGVVVVDVRRLLDEALPQILSANEPMLSKVNGEVDKIRQKTGLDLRKFNDLAVGMKTRQIDEKTVDFQPVLLARGPSETSAVEEAAKLASDGKMRAEEIAGRTVYVFSAKEIVDRNKPADKNGGSVFEQMMGKVLAGLSDEVALTAYDTNTVALGSLERMRELLGESPRVNSRLLGMIGKNQTAVANFGMIVPEGLSGFLDLEEDELGEGLDSVREMNGSLDVVPGKTNLWIAARTADVKQAETLEIMLQGFQGLLSGILKKQAGEDKKVYGRMLENLSVKRKEAELMLNLEIPQKDLNVIIGKK